MLKVNDRVKLSERCIGTFRRKAPDWRTRRGTVTRVSKQLGNVFVLWDGRLSADQWPTAAIEKVEDDPDC